MSELTREQILELEDRETIKITVPKWGDLYIKTLSSHEKDKFDASNIGKNGGTNFVNIRARLVVAALVNEDGTKKFKDEDIPKLALKSGPIMDRIYSAIQQHNNYSDEDLEQIAKNS